MFKLIFILLILMTSLKLFSLEREIVVLTSINTPKRQPFWRSKNYQISKDIEDQYRSYLDKSGYKITFVHNSDQETLSNYLQSDKTLVLFWVSHAAGKRKQSLFSLDSIIQDSKGNNVKNIFQKINQNIKFVSIVGCQTRKIIDGFKKRSLYHNDLVIQSFEKKIRLNLGIYKSVRAAAQLIDIKPNRFRKKHVRRRGVPKLHRNYIKGKPELFDSPVVTSKTSANDKKIIFHVVNSNPSVSAIITRGESYVGLLKKGLKEQTFSIKNGANQEKIKLKITYDVSVLRETSFMNPLLIISDDNYYPEYLKDLLGNPFGLNQNYYYLKKG